MTLLKQWWYRQKKSLKNCNQSCITPRSIPFFLYEGPVGGYQLLPRTGNTASLLLYFYNKTSSRLILYIIGKTEVHFFPLYFTVARYLMTYWPVWDLRTGTWCNRSPFSCKAVKETPQLFLYDTASTPYSIRDWTSLMFQISAYRYSRQDFECKSVIIHIQWAEVIGQWSLQPCSSFDINKQWNLAGSLKQQTQRKITLDRAKKCCCLDEQQELWTTYCGVKRYLVWSLEFWHVSRVHQADYSTCVHTFIVVALMSWSLERAEKILDF